MNNFSILILVLFSFPFSAPASPLEKQLRKNISRCLDAFTDFSEKEKKEGLNFQFELEPQKGFAHVAGETPTCGCPCSITSGAYSTKIKGQYVFLTTDQSSCRFSQEIKTNKPNVSALFSHHPARDFGLPNTGKEQKGVFVLIPKIPREGTNTHFEIRIVPFGLKETCIDHLCFSHSMKEKNISAQSKFRDLIKKISNFDSVENLLKDSALNEVRLGKQMATPLQKEELTEFLEFLINHYESYKIYKSAKYKSVIYKWSKTKEIFTPKKKRRTALKHSSYKNFLLKSPYFDYVC